MAEMTPATLKALALIRRIIRNHERFGVAACVDLSYVMAALECIRRGGNIDAATLETLRLMRDVSRVY